MKGFEENTLIYCLFNQDDDLQIKFYRHRYAPIKQSGLQVLAASGLGLIAYAGLASGEDWKEFFQYFRQSKFVCQLPESLLSFFADPCHLSQSF